MYQMSSFLQGLDICFKSFHVLNVHYPLDSEHIWLIIQRVLYEFNTDTINHSVKKMIYCPFCKTLFNRSRFLTHIKQHHVSQINLECQCPYENCGSKFSRVYGYKKHALLYHKQDNGSENTIVNENESESSAPKQNQTIHFDPNSDKINIIDD
ncbi:hypothetical protein PV327_011578, partial [Microctonus hyperodae]